MLFVVIAEVDVGSVDDSIGVVVIFVVVVVGVVTLLVVAVPLLVSS